MEYYSDRGSRHSEEGNAGSRSDAGINRGNQSTGSGPTTAGHQPPRLLASAYALSLAAYVAMAI
jgi:hypothetical protein